jgi:methionyl-tRNA formyltransferase
MEITDDTYIQDIYEFGTSTVPDMYVSTLSDIESGTADARPQPADSSEVLRCYPRREEDSRLDWTQSAVELDRIVRASAKPLFGAYTYYNGDKLRVWQSSVEQPEMDYLGEPGQVAHRRPDDETVAVVTGEGFLILEMVSTSGDDPQPATEVISSNRDRLGIHTPEEVHQLRERVRHLEQKQSND